MKLIVETSIKEDNNEINAFSIVVNKDEIAKIAAKKGLAGANKAIDGLVEKFTSLFKRKLAEALNK